MTSEADSKKTDGARRYVSLRVNETGFRERNRPLSLLLDLGDLLLTNQDSRLLLDKSLKMIMDYFGLAAGRMYLMDPAGRHLRLAACRGLAPEGLEKVLLTEGFTGKSARDRAFIAQPVTDLADRARAGLLEDKGLKIVFCTPLVNRDALEGVMNLAGREIMDISDEFIDTMIAAGQWVAAALSQARLMDEILEKGREIESQNQILKFLAAGALHDLKSPAVALHGLTRRMESEFSESLGPKGRLYCRNIMNASMQMLGLIGELNVYIAARSASLVVEEFSPADVLEQIREEYSEVLEEKNIAWRSPENPPKIRADRLALTRVVRNLIENALKYGGAGLSLIKIDWREDDDFFVLSVSDNGVGVRAEDTERLFDLFRRLENSRGTEGTGIGLAVVKETATRHGGDAWVDQAQNDGLTVCFSFSKFL